MESVSAFALQLEEIQRNGKRARKRESGTYSTKVNGYGYGLYFII